MSRAAHALVALAALFFLWMYQAAGEEPKTKDGAALTTEEKRVLDLTNEARKKEGLPPLKANAVLSRVARAHSANMAKQGKAEHVLDGKDPPRRISDAGYRYALWGENIYYTSDQGAAASRGAVKWWLGSSGHRANILHKGFQEIGIGLARSDDGTTYYTQVFGTPRR
jgi:uncharacterized protein YkwD